MVNNIVSRRVIFSLCGHSIRRSVGNKLSFLSTTSDSISIASILQKVSKGTLSVKNAENQLQSRQTAEGNIGEWDDDPNRQSLKKFANLDHNRAVRTSFPEVIFASGKTPSQLVAILDDMADNVNKLVEEGEHEITPHQKAILATRVSKEVYEKISSMPLKNGTIFYHEIAKIVSMKASALEEGEHSGVSQMSKVIVSCAGTTDIPVAEEAAVTLEAAGCDVERIYDIGVAGLHRVVNAIPKLRHTDVGCIIVCAGMDGALPSVVAGLVHVPVIAVPTSIGYGSCFGGLSAMLTMLNSCAPGIGIVNIDNGFGGAALAFKCINLNRSAS